MIRRRGRISGRDGGPTAGELAAVAVGSAEAEDARLVADTGWGGMESLVQTRVLVFASGTRVVIVEATGRPDGRVAIDMLLRPVPDGPVVATFRQTTEAAHVDGTGRARLTMAAHGPCSLRLEGWSPDQPYVVTAWVTL